MFLAVQLKLTVLPATTGLGLRSRTCVADRDRVDIGGGFFGADRYRDLSSLGHANNEELPVVARIGKQCRQHPH